MKTVLIAQGDQDIGFALCESFQAAGYRVIFLLPEEENLEGFEFLTDLSIPLYQWDLNHFETCQKGVLDLQRSFGSIDVFVHQAKSFEDSSLSHINPQSFLQGIQSNIHSVFCMCKSMLHCMRSCLNGRIINIASMSAYSGNEGMIMDAASKAAVVGFTKSLSKEIASFGATANVIAPGKIRKRNIEQTSVTGLIHAMQHIPLKRMGVPEEVASLAVFLASENASFITGTTLSVDGGQSNDFF